MWIIPSRGRPHNIQRLASYAEIKTAGVVAIDDDEIDKYIGLRLPKDWRVISTPPKRFGPKTNEIFRLFPDQPWYGTMNDDMLPKSKDWDVELVMSAGDWGIAYADDEFNHRAGCVVFGGKLIRALGWICCPPLLHFFNDDCHELMIRDLGGIYREDIKVPHLHYSNHKAKKDQTYKDRPPIESERPIYEKWKETEWPAILQKIKSALPLPAS